MLEAMFRKFTPIALILVCSIQSAMAVNADAPSQPDELQMLLVSKGLLSKLGNQIVDTGAQITERTSDLVGTAIGFLGIPYRRGGSSAETGFDCSGFVRAIYKETIGLVLPRTAAEQASATQSIDKNQLKPGDLVFFNTLKRTFSHVGIYLGENKFIHSPRTGSSVRIDDMRIPYWNVRFDGARRVATADTPVTAITSAAIAAPAQTPKAASFPTKSATDAY
jgi:cell wall-associated NlpC family hydrolase